MKDDEDFGLVFFRPFTFENKRQMLDVLTDMYRERTVPLVISYDHDVLKQASKTLPDINFEVMMIPIQYKKEFLA